MNINHVMATIFMTSIVTSGSLTTPGETLPQTSSTQRIEVDGARPLLEAVKVLQTTYGVVINYEDPPYHPSEGVDVTEMRNQGKPLPKTREIIPRGGPFSFEYRLPPGPRVEGLGPVLADLVRQFHATRHGQEFRVDKNGDTFSIVPTSRRVARSVDEPYQAILDTQLRFEPTGRERSAEEVIMDLADALQHATGVPVHVGTIPSNLLAHTVAPDLAGSMSARTALARVLSSTGRRVSWVLLTGPREPLEWWLNIAIVRD